MSKRNAEDDRPIPEVVYDSNTKTTYKKGQFLGKVNSYFNISYFVSLN